MPQTFTTAPQEEVHLKVILITWRVRKTCFETVGTQQYQGLMFLDRLKRRVFRTLHLRGKAGFVNEHQTLRIKVRLEIKPVLSSLQDVFTLLLQSKSGLF